MLWLILIGVLAALFVALWIWTDLIVRRAEQRFPPIGKFIKVNELRLHYVERGTGQTVILLHGDSGSVLDFTISPLMDMLCRDYRVIAFDRPGLGYSQRPHGGASPFVQARMIREAINALGVKNPVLVGHSRGGPVCLAYGIDYPYEVAGVVNVAGGAFYQGGGPSFFNLLTIPLIGRLLANTVAVPFGKGVVKMTLDMAFSPDRIPPLDYLEAYSAMELRPDQLMASADDVVNSVSGMKLLIQRYPEIRFPLVSVHGNSDLNVNVAWSQQLQRQVPGSGLIVVANSGHEVMFNHPEAIAEGIRTVLQVQHPRSSQAV
ncbi:MAG: alpha/beta hydrolase [Anaerolineales bacterium]|nr:alpha/beta hydrolase [Anaerolineales bacterium]